jgi:hypothetical protein
MTSARLLAEWSHDPGCSCSRTSLGCSLLMAGTLWPMSFRDWPRSATWDATGYYELPTLAPLTSGSGSSSSRGLLPTPAAGNFNDGESPASFEARRHANLAKGINGNGQGTPLAIAAQRLLPTPVVTNRAGMEPSPATQRGTRGADLGPVIGDLLKTPTAQLGVNGGSQHPDKRKAGGHGPTLADQVEHQLLPTPQTAYDGRSQEAWREAKGRAAQKHQAGEYAPGTGAPGMMDLQRAVALLPTPRATDGTHGGPNQRGSSGDLMLPSAVMSLLPTPTAADGDRTSLTMQRGNPSLLGELTSLPSGDGSES